MSFQKTGFVRNFLLLAALISAMEANAQVKLYVAPHGKNTGPGTAGQPFKTIEFAVQRALQITGKDVTIGIAGGTYNLLSTIEITSESYALRSLCLQGLPGQNVVVKGSQDIFPKWQMQKNGRLVADIDFKDAAPDRLFLNGRALPMARYPNYDSSTRHFNGTASDAISDERVAKWKNPAGGYIHALHSGEWGGFHYRITGKSPEGKLLYEGGWQNNRPSEMHKDYRFVENIFEELDAPGEWYYDASAKKLYLYPPAGIVLKNAKFSVSRLTDLIHIKGTGQAPVKNISIKNIRFTETSRSFMLTKEPLLRSDWTIYRGGAVLLDGTENCTIKECSFYELGGNAVFISNYNKQDSVLNNRICNIGASAISFVGSADAVRSPAFQYDLSVPWSGMDYTPGPKTNNYPQYCVAEGNLVHDIGRVEKQVAGVEISMSAHIIARHNTIYNLPRAGINIGDGCWGGHIIEYNDVFNTVLETGDHGAFNSWGRDRFWSPDRSVIDSIVAAKPGIELLDMRDPVILRNNRFHCGHGWDIDLDDGSSNYEIYNNVCLNGGIKLREGYHRTVRNNIIVNNTFHPHVWLKNSGDVFVHNIVTTPYAPILMNDWGDRIDSNFFLSASGLVEAQKQDLDKHSAWGNAGFADTKSGNYTVSASSPAFAIGFRNFEMNFGVTGTLLKKEAAKPVIKNLFTRAGEQKGEQVRWLGAGFKNVETLGEQSAAGLHDKNGALLADLPAGSAAQKNSFHTGDVLIRINDKPVNSISELLEVYQGLKWMGQASCVVIRNQAPVILKIQFNK